MKNHEPDGSLPIWIEADSIQWPDKNNFAESDNDALVGLEEEHLFQGSVEEVDSAHDRIELKVVSAVPTILVVADYYHPDWKAKLVDQFEGIEQPLPTHRVNRVLRGVPIPAGRHHIVLYYDPPNYFTYAWISCLVWGLVLWSLVALRRQARQ